MMHMQPFEKGNVNTNSFGRGKTLLILFNEYFENCLGNVRYAKFLL